MPQPVSLSSWLALLGSHPEFSLAEIEAVCDGATIDLIHPQFARINFSSSQQFATMGQLQSRLGGSIKILEPIATLPLTAESPQLESSVIEYLTQLQKVKVTFGLGSYGLAETTRLDGMSLKKSLSKADIKARWIQGPTTGLSAAVLLHQPQVLEFMQIKTANNLVLAVTEAVQDIDDWTRRDRGKPYADHAKGMLPPKVARMMVNLAIGHLNKDELKNATVFDPFCGSGTVLMEAGMLGVSNLVGSDVDQKATLGAQTNLDWLKLQYGVEFDALVFPADATHANERIKPKSISHLITEPFLGKQTPQADQIPNIIRGLGKLYLGSFKRWTRFLATGAKVVIIFPSFAQSNRSGESDFSSLIKRLATLGFQVVADPKIYSRPNAIVKRQIWQFQYQPMPAA